MRAGLVFGKFMPLHKGHMALINFALKNCDHLNVVLCYTYNEPIDGFIRKQWLNDIYGSTDQVRIVSFEYDENILPNTSVSSKDVSKKWAEFFRSLVPETTIVFTSESYGEYVAEYMNVKHLSFDKERSLVNISASLIRQQPFRYWDYLPVIVHPYFTRKVCLIGTESTGKSTLTEKLAKHFNTTFVTEMGREIVEVTDTCIYEDLLKISAVHASAIIEKTRTANKLLFVDTDVNITASYSEFLFNRPLEIEGWIEEANQFDLYLFLEPDCDFVQDGTRLSVSERNRLSDHHRSFFQKKNIQFASVGGNWENRFVSSCKIVENTFDPLS